MSPASPVKQNLVALGSAAVLTVYAAGFFRTKAAADQFAAEDAAPRRSVAASPLVPTAVPPQTAPDSPLVSSLAAPTQPDPTPPPSAPKAATATRTPAQLADTASGSPGNPATVVAQAIANAVDSASAAVVVSSPPPAVPQQPPATSATQAAAAATDPSRGPYKDGRYSGWGTSRHGNIQATVEIRDGHITSAVISQCLTRYSCSWISALPPQVVARQSAEVDYVSGATQSTNAFYYAVVQALSQAK